MCEKQSEDPLTVIIRVREVGNLSAATVTVGIEFLLRHVGELVETQLVGMIFESVASPNQVVVACLPHNALDNIQRTAGIK
jgi:hypothetical protein